jgi:hypothetical protein
MEVDGLGEERPTSKVSLSKLQVGRVRNVQGAESQLELSARTEVRGVKIVESGLEVEIARSSE